MRQFTILLTVDPEPRAGAQERRFEAELRSHRLALRSANERSFFAGNTAHDALFGLAEAMRSAGMLAPAEVVKQSGDLHVIIDEFTPFDMNPGAATALGLVLTAEGWTDPKRDTVRIRFNDLQELRKRVDVLTERVEERVRQLNSRDYDLKELREKHRGVREQLREKTTELDSFRETYEVLNTTCRELRTENEELRQRWVRDTAAASENLERVKFRLKEQRRLRHEVEEEVDRMRRELHRVAADRDMKVSQAGTRLGELTMTLKGAEERIGILQHDLDKLNGRLQAKHPQTPSERRWFARAKQLEAELKRWTMTARPTNEVTHGWVDEIGGAEARSASPETNGMKVIVEEFAGDGRIGPPSPEEDNSTRCRWVFLASPARWVARHHKSELRMFGPPAVCPVCHRTTVSSPEVAP